MDPPPPPPPPRALPVPPLAPPVLLTPQVWEVIVGAVAGEIADPVADPSVRVPAVGAAVRYLPHLHASSSAQLPEEYIDCHVHGVLLLADPVTLELLAEVTLSRHPPQHPLPAPAPAPAPAEPIRFFSKRVSPSDVGHRIWVGRAGNSIFGTFRPVKDLAMHDVFGTRYVLHRNANRTITKGWPGFAEGKVIRTGDRVVFMKRGGDRLIALRRFFSEEELEMARAPEQDVHDTVQRLDGGELVTVTIYPGRSGTFLVEPEPEPEVHTPPPSDSEEDEVPSVVVLSSGSETDIPAASPAQEKEEDVVPSTIAVSSDSETESSGSEMDDDPSDYSIVSLTGQILHPDRPVPRVTRMTGIPLPRGVRVKALVILYTPLRGRRGI